MGITKTRNKFVEYDSKIAFSGGNKKVENLADGTAPNDAVNKGQLDAVQSLIENFEWQDSALDYVVDNTLVPATEVTGDRYILSHDGGAPNAAWDGAAAGDIVEFNGTTWDAVTPTLGTFISADDESDVLYYWGGAAWATKSFEATTASTGLSKVGFDIQLADQNQNGIDVTSGVIGVDALDGTITVAAGGISVGTITSAKVSDFNTASETAIFTVANFVDGTTIDFTVTAGASVTAEVKDNSLNEDKLLGLGTGTAGEVVTSDGAGGFTYAADAGSLTEKYTSNASAVTSGDGSLSVTDIFGADDPSTKTIPVMYVGGSRIDLREDKLGDAYLSNDGGTTAVAFNALAGTESLYWNGAIAGVELDATDTINAHYSVD